MMKARTLLTSTSTTRVVGLLVLAGVSSIARPVVAQTEGGCILLPGQTAPDDPSVTAQQVEDGSATVEEFALAVRERSREYAQVATTVEQGVYIGCIIREDDGIWRSGATYIVSLTPDGRVYIHAKNMALSGRLLNPVIYGAILTALGVSASDLTNLASPDPATAAQAFGALMGTLSQEPDGAFDATGPIPGLSPGIPGASGHAAVYVSPIFRAPIILLTGFDINESHLVSIDDESIDYGDPAITAEDVVDRRTLKAFVTQAGEWFLEIQRTGDAADASKTKIALRDPNGPWRHGSVYLYVLDLASSVITFHAVYPDRFELRPLVPTVTDAVTREFILPQVIEAATSSPEGGFVEYYFDDPTDDTDSADIPKVGYARRFAGQIQRTDGVIFPVNIIVGSGFYMAELPSSSEQFTVDEDIPDMPTGVWSPDLLSRASFSQVGGQTSIAFSHGGRIEEGGVAYTCMSSDGCEIEETRVAKGTILVSERAAQGELLVTGAAELVDVWTEFQGEIYNGYELDGSTATFRSAAGEITRVSFLDPGGDLVFIDFSSDDPATEVVITLEDYSGSLEDSPYDQPGTQYGRGLATISVVNPTETTWLSVFSVGNDIDRVDLALIGEETFADPVDGIADIRAIVVDGMGSIGMIDASNANLGGTSGEIGIDAMGVMVKRALLIGDITPGETAMPLLRISVESLDRANVAEDETVIIAILIKGGDLREATGDLQIDTGGMVYPFRILAAAGERSIGESAQRSDLGDGSLPAVTDTFVGSPDDYFEPDGQKSGVSIE